MAIEYDAQLVGKYVKIRDALAEVKKTFDAETKRMKDALEKLEGVFQGHLNDEDAESIVTPYGTVYTKVRSSVSVKDRDVFYQFALDTENLGVFDMKANVKVVRELLEEGTEVPGIKFSESKVIGVRRK